MDKTYKEGFFKYILEELIKLINEKVINIGDKE